MAIRRLNNSSVITGSKSSKLWDGETFLPYYESIASFTSADDTTGFYTFTDIPQNFTHLQIRASMRTTSAASFDYGFLRFNGDTSTSNYRNHTIYGDGSGAYSFDYGAGRNYLLNGTTSGNANTSYFGASVIDILDYSNPNKNTTVKSLSGIDVNGPGGYVFFISGVYLQNTPITSITYGAYSGALSTNSKVCLYGIRAR